MICPILSHTTKDNEGNVVWDHHECIENSCTFWAEDASDCALRASGLLVIQRARASLTAGNGSGPQPGEPLFSSPAGSIDEKAIATLREAIDRSVEEMRDTGIKLLEGVAALEGPISAGDAALGARFDSLNETMTGLSQSIEGGFAGIQEGFDKIRRAVEKEDGEESPQWLHPLEDSLSSMSRQLGSFEKEMAELKSRPEYLDPLESSLSSMSRQLEKFEERLNRIAEEFGAGQRERLEEIRRSVDDRMDSFGRSVDRIADVLGTVAGCVDGMSARHDEIASALSEEAMRRKDDEERRRKDDSQAMNARGVALFYRGASEAAGASFRAAVELDPDFAEAHNNLGLALSAQGKDSEAEGAFRRALEIDPEMAEALNNLGFLFHKGMEFEKAVDMFRRAALGSNDSSMAWTNLGNACYKLAKYGEAVDAWKKAIEANPLNESAKRSLQMFQQEQTGGV